MFKVLDSTEVFLNTDDKILKETKEEIQLLSGSLFLKYYAKRILKNSKPEELDNNIKHIKEFTNTLITNGYTDTNAKELVAQVIDNFKKKNTYSVTNIINKNENLFPSISIESEGDNSKVDLYGKIVQSTFEELNNRFSKIMK